MGTELIDGFNNMSDYIEKWQELARLKAKQDVEDILWGPEGRLYSWKQEASDLFSCVPMKRIAKDMRTDLDDMRAGDVVLYGWVYRAEVIRLGNELDIIME